MRSILFYIGPVPIRAYGLMLWIAIVVGLWRTVRAARRTDIKSEHVIDLAIYAVLGGVLSAHLTSILLDLRYYLSDPSAILTLWSGILSPSGGLRGLSFHGGLIGAIGVAYLYTRRKKIPFLEMVDLLAPGLAIAYAITRVGCLLNGCCYGIPTHLPWAVRFHEDGGLTPPSHPTQIYGSLANILIYLGLVLIARKRRFTGQVFYSYLVMYSVYRFFLEFLRKGVTAEVAFAGLTQAQLVSMFALLILLSVLIIKYRRTSAPAIRNPSRPRTGSRRRRGKSAIRNMRGSHVRAGRLPR